MNEQTAKKLIDKTRDDYNLIADQFASTRKFNWGDFAIALRSLPIKKGAKILDLGCGNGRVYELLKDMDVDFFGLDLSDELIKIAKKTVPNGHFQQGNMLETPYNDNEFDIVICVATLHHIPSRESREQAVREIYRITKPGGYVLVTNWYFWNKPFYVKQIVRNVWLQWRKKSNLDPGDFAMPWRTGDGNIVTRRYFHAWRKTEMQHVFKIVGFQNIKVALFNKRNRKIGYNLIATAQKPK